MLLIDEAEFDRQAGARLHGARQTAGVRVATLAEHMGLSGATVRAHERGSRSISPGQAIRYAILLAVTPGWLLFGELARPQAVDHAASPGERRSFRGEPSERPKAS